MKIKHKFSNTLLNISVLVSILVLITISSVVFTRSNTASADYNPYLSFELMAESSDSDSQEIYILFEGITGEVQEDGHQGWCKVSSFEQGHVQVKNEGIGRSNTDVVFDDIRIVKPLDKASPKLAEAVCDGSLISNAHIDFCGLNTYSERVIYYSYQLGNVHVTSYSISGSSQSEDVPMETITLSFNILKATYTEFDEKGKAKGTVEYTWQDEQADM